MSKKTRVKLVGAHWDRKKNPYLAGTFGDHNQFDIIEVDEIDTERKRFTYNGWNLWDFSADIFEIEILPDEPAPEPEKPFEFRANDRVKCAFFGEDVFILGESLDGNSLWFLKGPKEYHFYRDGRYTHEHTAPVLTLVERPKKTVKKTYWVAVYDKEKHGFKAYSEVIEDLEHLRKEIGFCANVSFHQIQLDVLCD